MSEATTPADPEWTVDITYRVRVGPAPTDLEAIDLAKGALRVMLNHPTLGEDVHVWMRDLHVWADPETVQGTPA